ncbi:hypothetical protein GQ457_10G011010 [Hibiscus cannabinus]
MCRLEFPVDVDVVELALKLHCCCGGFEHYSLSFQAYALFPTMQIASLGKAKRQGGSSITFVQVRFFPEFCISGLEYRYLISGIGTQIQHWNLGIGTAREGIGTP